VFGRIVAGSVDADALGADDPYADLRMFAFLEDSTYGVIEQARQVGKNDDRGGAMSAKPSPARRA
jgi:hypothetical protein